MVTFQRSKNERRIKERGSSKEGVGRGWEEESQTVRGCEEEGGRQKKTRNEKNGNPFVIFHSKIKYDKINQS